MSSDGLHEQPREPGGPPAASLTLVRVQRRRASLQPSRKAGDLTQRLMEVKAPAPALASAPTPVPPPASAPVAAAPAPIPAMLPPPPEPRVAEPTYEPAPTLIALPPPAPAVEPDEAVVEPVRPQTIAGPPALRIDEAPESFDEAPEPRLLAPFATVVDPVLEPPAEPVSEIPEIDDNAAGSKADAEHALPPHGADALIDYWDELAGDRLFPAFAELDRERLEQNWPNSVLLTFGNGDMPRLTRLGEPDGEVEYNLMVTDWILSRGRQAAERAEALEEEQRFPVGRERARYRLVLLPCSNDGERVDHMLCHVSRIAEAKLSAVGAFKRWLAS